MSDFSRPPLDVLAANQQQDYVGIRIEQGVPLLDRDLNLLQDLIAATVRSVITRYIGNGVAANSDAFGIRPTTPESMDFAIAKGPGDVGACMVGGIEAVIRGDTTYTTQPNRPFVVAPLAALPGLKVPTTAQWYMVYLDVWLSEVDSTDDADLANSQDVGMETAVRLKALWVVRVVDWAEGRGLPDPPPGHAFCPLADIKLPVGATTITAAMITDRRQRRLTMAEIEQRLSRVEKLLTLPAFVPPSQAQFSPASGPIRRAVQLFGSHFNLGAPVILFGNLPAKVLSVQPNQIITQVPPGLTPDGVKTKVSITVKTDGGMTVSDTLFEVLPVPAFVDPGGQFNLSNGAPGQSVTLNGWNFNAPDLVVQFVPQVASAGAAVTVKPVGPVTATQVTVPVPSGLGQPGQNVPTNIKLTASGQSVLSDDVFTINVGIPAPTIDSQRGEFSPQNGRAGQTVQIFGDNLNFSPVVTFGSVQAKVQDTSQPGQILVQVPAGIVIGTNPVKVKITVTTASNLSAESQQTFRVDP